VLIAQTEAVQFCTKDYQPLDGIYRYLGYIAPGVERYDCYENEPDCALCDCDGTWIMELKI